MKPENLNNKCDKCTHRYVCGGHYEFNCKEENYKYYSEDFNAIPSKDTNVVKFIQGGERLDGKACRIINGKFSQILEVDGHSIAFQGGYNADYFEKHYAELGYSVVKVNKN